jgi:hypothetical protein
MRGGSEIRLKFGGYSRCGFLQQQKLQFIVFPAHHLLLFLATEPSSGGRLLASATNSTKKQLEGRNELKYRFSDGPSKMSDEPLPPSPPL